MNRRKAFRAILGAAGAGVAVSARQAGGPIVTGEMDSLRCCILREQGIDVSVFFDGVDVTNRIIYADDVTGVVRTPGDAEYRGHVRYVVRGRPLSEVKA